MTSPVRLDLKLLPWIIAAGMVAMPVWLWFDNPDDPSPHAISGIVWLAYVVVIASGMLAFRTRSLSAPVRVPGPDGSDKRARADSSGRPARADTGSKPARADSGSKPARADSNAMPARADTGDRPAHADTGDGPARADGSDNHGFADSSDERTRAVVLGAPPPPRTPTATSMPAVEPRAGISIIELSPGMAEIAIEVRPGTQEMVRGKAWIGSRGEWPALVDRGLELALAELVNTAEGGASALASNSMLAPRCWEGTLYTLVPGAVVRLVLYRVLPGGQAPSAEPRPAQIEADGTVEASLTRAWHGRPGIAHMVGRFFRTRQGSVEMTTDLSSDLSMSSSQQLKQYEFPDARLVIVQCQPWTDEMSRQSIITESELAREYALGALRRSAACGLVIPPIPARLLEDFTTRLVAGLGYGSRAELIDMARDLRVYLRDQHCMPGEFTLVLRDDVPA